jgi:glycerophosphoryl diester phosphodiesterase
MRTPWIVAHRGASANAPENTMASFERAVELGATFIETDLHLTRDARFVAIHDSHLERTTNGRGAVREQSLAELRKLDAGMWFDRQYMDQRIPTLEEVLDFAKKHDVIFYLEIKYDSAWGMHSALVSALQGAEIAARTVVLSFDPATLETLRRLDGALLMGLLVDQRDGDPVAAAVEVGARQLCPRADLVTPKLVETAHRADLRVVTWTVNETEKMRAAITAQVDGIITDVPDRLRALLEDSRGTEASPAASPR